jgi:hypothetical protein
MIHCMSLHLHRAFCGVFGTLSLASAFAASPQLTVRMYTVSPISSEVLDVAAAEAARVLRPVPVSMGWLNCSAPARPDICETPELATDLRIRLLPKALLEASPSALGIAMWSESGGSAALFYDRALLIRRPGVFLSQILGRAMAHEVVHLLLGTTSHQDLGLMRQELSLEDFRFNSDAGLELTSTASAALRKEAARRIAMEHGRNSAVSAGLAAKPRSTLARP